MATDEELENRREAYIDDMTKKLFNISSKEKYACPKCNNVFTPPLNRVLPFTEEQYKRVIQQYGQNFQICSECNNIFDPNIEKSDNANSVYEERLDFSKRILCSDGTCIGVVNENGFCKVCGKSYSQNLDSVPGEKTEPVTGAYTASIERLAANNASNTVKSTRREPPHSYKAKKCSSCSGTFEYNPPDWVKGTTGAVVLGAFGKQAASQIMKEAKSTSFECIACKQLICQTCFQNNVHCGCGNGNFEQIKYNKSANVTIWHLLAIVMGVILLWGLILLKEN